MSLFEQGELLINLQTKESCQVCLVMHNSKGYLYTVQYIDSGKYRRYYEPKLSELFKSQGFVASIDMGSNILDDEIEYATNLIKIDFINKRRVS